MSCRPTATVEETLISATVQQTSSAPLEVIVSAASTTTDTVVRVVGVPLTGETYVHTQSVPETAWAINHNLGKFPSVSVVDSGGSVVIGDVQYIDDDNVVVRFTAAFGGKAYLN